MHITDFVDLLCYIVTLASILVKFTPNPKDDEFMAKVKDALSKIALNSKV